MSLTPSKPPERNFLDAALGNVEALIDAFTDNEAIEAIPIFGTALKLCKGLDDVRNRVFAAKLLKFLNTPELQSKNAKEKLKQGIGKSPEEAARVGQVLFLALEKMSDLDKPPILAKIFVAYLDEIIELQTFRRLAVGLEMGFIDDILDLINSPDDLTLKQSAAWQENLLGTGFVKASPGESWADSGQMKYSITELAVSLRTCMQHSKQLSPDSVGGTHV